MWFSCTPFPFFARVLLLFAQGVLEFGRGRRMLRTCPDFFFSVAAGEELLKFRRVTIRGAQPSARLSEEICLSEGSAGVSQRALRGLSEGSAGLCRGSPRVLRGSAGVRGIFRSLSGVVTLSL